MELLNTAYSMRQLEARRYLLGGICLGNDFSDGNGTLLQLPLPLLEKNQKFQELFWTDTEPVTSRFVIPNGTVRFSKINTFLFGQINVIQDLAEQDMVETSLQAYRALLQLCKDCRTPNLLRIWNYVPYINALEGVTERYRLFNVGRKQALSEYQQTVSYGSPAASALGSFDNTLRIAFLASTHKPQAIENPRQVSAYFYPQGYGIVPPIFSRAALFFQNTGVTLFISGTASIVGHESMHRDDVDAQTCETLRNLTSVLRQANSAVDSGWVDQTCSNRPWSLAELQCRVYIRYPEHLSIVRNILHQEKIKQATYLQADICRKELLVEIEATASCFYQNSDTSTVA